MPYEIKVAVRYYGFATITEEDQVEFLDLEKARQLAEEREEKERQELWQKIQDQIYTDGQKKESAKVGFPAGTTIYVKVEPSGWSYPNGVAYNLTANATPSSTWETEYNNSMASADMLVNGTTFSGTIMNDDDEADYYKFTTTKTGTLSFTFQQDPSEGDHNGAWTINIYDADKNKLQEQEYTAGAKIETANLGLPAGTTVYVEVEPSGWSYPNGVVYNLTANNKANSAWETEYNNTKKTADTLALNKVTYGTIMHSASADVDYYKVYAYAGNLNVSLKSDASNEGEIKYGWKVSILNANLKELGTVTTKTKDSVSATITKAGYYYVKVETGSSWSSDYEQVYDLKAINVKQAAAKAPVAKKSAITVKWSKVAAAKGYQIRYATNTKMKSAKSVKITNGSTTSKKISGLKSKTKYFVQIRAYKTGALNNKTVYGPWSAKKSITTK